MRLLRPYQADANEWARDKYRAFFVLEMRLGKTLLAVRWMKRWASRFASDERDDWVSGAPKMAAFGRRVPGLPVLRTRHDSAPLTYAEKGFHALVIAPLSVHSAWEREFRLEKISATDLFRIRGTRSQRIEKSLSSFECERSWCLLNYEACALTQEIFDLPWDCVILDESDTIRNPQPRVSKFLTTRCAHIPLRAALSGLPNPESSLDLFNQFKYLYGSWMGYTNFYEWRWNCCMPAHQLPSGVVTKWTPRPKTRRRIQRQMATRAYVLTRKQAGLGETKVRETLVVPASKKQARQYRSVRDDFEIKASARDYDHTDAVWSTRWVLAKVTALHRLAGGFSPTGECVSRGKVMEVQRLLTTQLRGEQVVIWFRFNAELREVKKQLSYLRISNVHVTGKVKKDERDQRIARFQKGKAQIFLCQTSCAAVGVDLSAADTAIYFSNYFSHRIRRQSEDRIVSVRKKVPLLYVDLCTEGTGDETLVSLLRKKYFSSRVLITRYLRGIE
jgi:helicase-like protein/SNF2 domain-containing protein